MNTEKAHQKSSSTNDSNGVDLSAPPEHARAKVFTERATKVFVALPSKVDAQVKSNPYQALAFAAVAGAALGVVLSSRILRTAVASAASIALVELGRSYFVRDVEPAQNRA